VADARAASDRDGDAAPTTSPATGDEADETDDDDAPAAGGKGGATSKSDADAKAPAADEEGFAGKQAQARPERGGRLNRDTAYALGLPVHAKREPAPSHAGGRSLASSVRSQARR